MINNRKSGKMGTAFIWAAGTGVCCLLTYWLLNLRHASLLQPLTYIGGDEFPIAMWVKQIQETGWVLFNPRLGMPFPPEVLNYPMPDAFNFLVLKFIGMIVKSYGTVMNIFYLATFPLAFLSSLYVLRRMRIGFPSALVAALLYPFLPFHFMRAEAHMMLSAYYTVPLIIMVMYQIMGDDLVSHPTVSRPNRLRWLLLVSCLCLIVGSSGGAYYPFFSCVLLAVAGMVGALRKKSLHPLLTAVILAIVISLTVALSVAPNFLHTVRKEQKAFIRSPREAEIYGLKIAQMLLPTTQHRWKLLSDLKERYNHAPLVNENDTAALGVIGACGFLFLVGWSGYRVGCRRGGLLAPEDEQLLDSTALLAMSATLLATIGGFGSLIALVGFPQIRSYNRISVFVAFLCLLSVALLIDRLAGRAMTGRSRSIVYGIGLPLVLLAGILDQTRPVLSVEYQAQRARFKSDEQFVQAIEKALPDGSMVFQLPYVMFPESPNIFQMTAYDPLTGYLHSTRLRWSYGGTPGGRADIWQREVTGMQLPEMLKAIALGGFAGLYLDRYGFPEGGHTIEREITSLLNETPLKSSNRRLLFYDLQAYVARLRAEYSDEEWALAQEQMLGPPVASFGKGFYVEESDGARKWHWTAASRAELELTNPLPRPRRAVIECKIFTGHIEPSDLRLDGDGIDRTYKVNSSGVYVTESITLLPGTTTIELTTNTKQVIAPADPRTMFLRLEGLKVILENPLQRK